MKSAISENDARSSLDAMWLAYRRAVAAGVGTHLKTLVSPHVVALVLYYRITRGNAEGGEGVEVAASTTYSYDNNGNLTAVGTSTTYSYDYQNRLATSTVNGITTTYSYDPFGNRISMAVGSTTTLYPSKYYSIATTLTGATTTTATSTEFIYTPGGNSTLLATIDQKLVNGTATGTPITRYNHTDNLGSTQVTSDSNGALAQWFNYAPYGSVLSSSNTGSTTAARQYIGQFTDASGLSYLNARYLTGLKGSSPRRIQYS